jgi:uncharacterized protein (TIGR02453 family)
MSTNNSDIHKIYEFLTLLEINNNREWFKENRQIYDLALQSFLDLVSGVLHEIAVFDLSINSLKQQDYIFRIYRDTRFSSNKAPYKNHFGAFIAPGGRSSGMAGYYLHIENEKTMVAGGVYMPPGNILKAIRTEILFNHEKFSDIINDEKFVNTFGQLDDYRLSRPPKDFPANHVAIELVKYKSYICSKFFENKDVLKPDFLSKTVSAFKDMYELNLFLNDSIRLTNEQ